MTDLIDLGDNLEDSADDITLVGVFEASFTLNKSGVYTLEILLRGL